jgi:hypothetical protein
MNRQTRYIRTPEIAKAIAKARNLLDVAKADDEEAGAEVLVVVELVMIRTLGCC